MVSHLPPMEKSVTGAAAANQRSYDWRGSLKSGIKNPFILKVGQIFTGFGVGCGVGIGVGRPIYLGSIPALQQVLTSTRGATDIFSGAGRHVNSYMRRFGVKGVEAGIGCGVGIGHGFGVGLALKPGVVQQVQSCVGQAMEKMMTNLGCVPGLSAVQSVVPHFVQSSPNAQSGSSDGDIRATFGDFTHLASKTSGSTFSVPTRNGSSTTESTHESLDWNTSSETSIASHSEKVINSFLQNPVFKNEEETKLNELAGKLRSKNNVLQMLLKHQEVIEELVEQNEKLRHILVDDLKVSPGKLETRPRSWSKFNNPCSDCLECRRKRTTR